MTDSLARYVLVAGLVPFLVMRIYWHSQAMRGRPRPENVESVGFKLVRILAALPMMVLVITYLIDPTRYAFASFALPDVIRWGGALLFFLSIAWCFWVNHALARNFSGMLVVYEGHQLVDHGPYRRIRHPMYTGFVGLMLGILTVSANWLVGLPPLLIIAVVMWHRTPREEQMLVEHFGDAYSSYMARTGRYLPRLG